MPGEVSVRKIAVALSLSISFAAVWAQELVVDLPVEPVRAVSISATSDLTLADTALQNDFPSFDRLYQRAPRPEYAELHRLWTWAMNDRFGAFYGIETYARLSSAYPGYADYIEQYRIVDSNGNLFYPTAETRRFLVLAAMRGLVAEIAPVKPVVVTEASVTPKTAEVAVMAPVSTTLVAASVIADPVVTAPAPARKPALQTQRASALPVPAGRSLPERRSGGLGRGIFLIIAGLLGAGTVSMMLHTSPEEREVRHS
ncbi:MAG: hypothetical protein ABIO78_02815 [Thermoanaerobaculia bacterium]